MFPFLTVVTLQLIIDIVRQQRKHLRKGTGFLISENSVKIQYLRTFETNLLLMEILRDFCGKEFSYWP